jgi:hypothetical protein
MKIIKITKRLSPFEIEAYGSQGGPGVTGSGDGYGYDSGTGYEYGYSSGRGSGTKVSSEGSSEATDSYALIYMIQGAESGRIEDKTKNDRLV